MKITRIKENSLAQEIGLSSGDRLLKINGERVLDHLDYEFRIADENVILDLQINGVLSQIIIEEDYDDDLGVEFEEMKIRKCGNDCVFCFVDQNPKNMRDGIYFRDGDYRMSYLYGHYITMTNMSKKELKRIVEQKLSPLYISVHATDVQLRKELLLYKWGKDDFLLKKIKYLIDNGIELHGQIVLIPNKNDGDQLFKTASDIYNFHPQFKTLSIVPVGLTRHREGLPQLDYVNKKYAESLFNIYPELNEKFPGNSSPFVILSDEWYILAGKPFPKKSFYGDYDLIENGVGQFRDFLDRFNIEKKAFPKSLKLKTKRKFQLVVPGPSTKKFTLRTGKKTASIGKNPSGREILTLSLNEYPCPCTTKNSISKVRYDVTVAIYCCGSIAIIPSANSISLTLTIPWP